MNQKMDRFFRSKLGILGLIILALYILVAIYAPFLASSKPLIVDWNGTWYFPLFRYLFFQGYYTKAVDLFFNLLIFTLPLALITRKYLYVALLQAILFLSLWLFPINDPANSIELAYQKQEKIIQGTTRDWNFDLAYMNDYEKLNIVLEEKRLKKHDERLKKYLPEGFKAFTPYYIQQQNLSIDEAYFKQRKAWLQEQHINYDIWPLIREFHWENDAGGDQSMNQALPWWEITRTNRKDLVASLIFGIRISLMVGVLAIGIAFLIGVPIGALAGFFAGKVDMAISRLLEVWEAMPAFFMLLLIVAMTQSKSIFLVILVIGLFGWTGFSRYIRGEFFKERSLPYVEACSVMGFSPTYTMFNHILPNAIPPLLTLIPFAILGAITSEAGLSFLGLGEEGSSSWGVLMDEGRQAFPAESYLLWPPAILLTILLIAIALVGDTLRDVLDPHS